MTVIEQVTPVTAFILNTRRPVQPVQNERLDLMVTGTDGQTWPAAVHRSAGVLGPHGLPDLLLSRGDDVVIAVVEGWPANVIIATDASPARCQAGRRQLDAGWDLAPPTDNWVDHGVFRTQIEDSLAEFRDEIGTVAVSRLQ